MNGYVEYEDWASNTWKKQLKADSVREETNKVKNFKIKIIDEYIKPFGEDIACITQPDMSKVNVDFTEINNGNNNKDNQFDTKKITKNEGDKEKISKDKDSNSNEKDNLSDENKNEIIAFEFVGTRNQQMNLEAIQACFDEIDDRFLLYCYAKHNYYFKKSKFEKEIIDQEIKRLSAKMKIRLKDASSYWEFGDEGTIYKKIKSEIKQHEEVSNNLFLRNRTESEFSRRLYQLLKGFFNTLEGPKIKTKAEKKADQRAKAIKEKRERELAQRKASEERKKAEKNEKDKAARKERHERHARSNNKNLSRNSVIDKPKDVVPFNELL